MMKMKPFSTGYEYKLVALGDIVAGQKVGRTSDRDITLFGGSGTGPSSGLGIQFAAVGKIVYDLARERRLGHEIPTDWLTEVHHP
jgi:ornithine cyclodeaminase/alanine dehydrogenase-like protein (mu-crystallin family)